ncbi:MAG: DUF2490 domain-containing protein [Candidatus Omnitrophica bacterium]|nr:DUF2490 domain-containing protein [Candidatus Omnitrophota bacterium]
MKLLLRGSLLLGLCGILICSGSDAWARDDWQFWQDTVLPVCQKGKFSSEFLQIVRFRDDISKLHYTEFKTKNLWKLHPNCFVSANYSYIQNRGTGDDWSWEHRPSVEIYPRVSLGDWGLENRSRLEMRIREQDPEDINYRYRGRFQVSHPLKIRGLEISAFINDEIFYDFPADKLNQNRFFLGTTVPAGKNWLLTASWGVQSLLSGEHWSSNQILQTQAKLRF